jgi:hypothetical protein
MAFLEGESWPIVLTTTQNGEFERKKILLKTLLPYGRDARRPSQVVASTMCRFSPEAAVEKKSYPDLQVTALRAKASAF